LNSRLPDQHESHGHDPARQVRDEKPANDIVARRLSAGNQGRLALAHGLNLAHVRSCHFQTISRTGVPVGDQAELAGG